MNWWWASLSDTLERTDNIELGRLLFGCSWSPHLRTGITSAVFQELGTCWHEVKELFIKEECYWKAVLDNTLQELYPIQWFCLMVKPWVITFSTFWDLMEWEGITWCGNTSIIVTDFKVMLECKFLNFRSDSTPNWCKKDIKFLG